MNSSPTSFALIWNSDRNPIKGGHPLVITGSLASHKGESLQADATTRKEAPHWGKTGLRLGLIVSAICRYTMSHLILWDGCQEFSLYRHDLHLTLREGRDAAEEASSKLWRQKHTPPGASIRLITQEELGKQHRHTDTHSHIRHTYTSTYTSQMSDWEYY